MDKYREHDEAYNAIIQNNYKNKLKNAYNTNNIVNPILITVFREEPVHGQEIVIST